MAPVDPHSFTDSSHPLATRIDLSLFLDFDAKIIHGSSSIHLQSPHSGELFLYTRSLLIHSASSHHPATPLPYCLHPPHPFKGSLLRLTLSGQRSFSLSFATHPSASALQWLDPSQTAGNKLPYLFTQCQSIHARSIFPCQDTPLARIQYSAIVNIPQEMRVVMSAAHLGRSAPCTGEAKGACEESRWTMNGRVVERFLMEQPIPPYLFALAAGDIAYQNLSPRSRVYTEPSELQRAAREFAGIEAMMQQGETLFGPYEWERFDVLVLPPSFPFGGMENPRMVFLTPTVIVGDGSGLHVLEHELAHSWTGNLITNATNNDAWLNEGFTTYAERRIVEALEGEERAVLHMGLGYSGLKMDIERFRDQPELTKLKTNQEGLDPDDIFSRVHYEKGFLFLRRLEQQVGRPSFDDFLKKYIARFRFTSIETETFVAFFKEQFPGIDKQVDLEMWIYESGIPPDVLEPNSAILHKVLMLAGGFSAGVRLSEEDFTSWQSLEWQIYLGNLPKKLSPEEIRELDEQFRFSENLDWEIRVAFLSIAALSAYQPCFPAIERTLHAVGRTKYLRPLYIGLLQSSPEAKEFAKRVFADASPKYHPIARLHVQGLLKTDH